MSVSSEFGRRAADDELCAEVRQAVEGGDEDALRRLGFGGFGGYVQRLSEIMSDSVTDGLDLSADDFGAIMGEVASPARYAHHLVNEAGTAIQSAKDKPLGIHIKPAEPDFDDDALCGTVGTAASKDDPERAVATLADGLGYAVKKAGNDFIKANAEQRSRAGFEVKVKRSGSTKCCPWCAARIGSWAIANAPDGVFGCHANCSCTVEYTSSTGAKTSARGANLHRYGAGAFVEAEYQPPHVLSDGEAPGAAEPKRLTKNPVESQPHRLTGGANGGIIEERSEAYNNLIMRLTSLGVENIPTSLFKETPSEELIIGRLAGGDMTVGACASLAFAYAGNKGGVDVLDFRGGKSRDFFSRNINVKDILHLQGVKGSSLQHFNDIAAAVQLLGSAEKGKEYILSTGAHTAVVRRKEKGFDYLELQDPKNNGFKTLSKMALVKRFDCKKSHSVGRQIIQETNFLIDLESLSMSQEFKDILGYINTPIDKQMKGGRGNVK